MMTSNLPLLEQRALELFGSYKLTDSQFNIGRVNAQFQRGLDVVEMASLDRYYLTIGSDKSAEEILSRKFGSQAILGEVEVDEIADVYEIPKGTRLLTKTLTKAPYSSAYMNSLAFRAGLFLRQIKQQDPGLFGADITAISTTEVTVFRRGSPDDIAMSIVSPLAAPRSAPPQSVDQLYEQALPYLLDAGQRDAYHRGLTEGNR